MWEEWAPVSLSFCNLSTQSLHSVLFPVIGVLGFLWPFARARVCVCACACAHNAHVHLPQAVLFGSLNALAFSCQHTKSTGTPSIAPLGPSYLSCNCAFLNPLDTSGPMNAGPYAF